MIRPSSTGGREPTGLLVTIRLFRVFGLHVTIIMYTCFTGGDEPKLRTKQSQLAPALLLQEINYLSISPRALLSTYCVQGTGLGMGRCPTSSSRPAGACKGDKASAHRKPINLQRREHLGTNCMTQTEGIWVSDGQSRAAQQNSQAPRSSP